MPIFDLAKVGAGIAVTLVSSEPRQRKELNWNMSIFKQIFKYKNNNRI